MTSSSSSVYFINTSSPVYFINTNIVIFALAGIQIAYDRRGEYWNMDATAYYLDEVLRLSDISFVPTEVSITDFIF